MNSDLLEQRENTCERAVTSSTAQGETLAAGDDPATQFSNSILRDFRGYLCGLCRSIRRDETSTVLVKVTGRAVDGKLKFQPVVICEHCMAIYAKDHLITMAKTDKPCNAFTVAQ